MVDGKITPEYQFCLEQISSCLMSKCPKDTWTDTACRRWCIWNAYTSLWESAEQCGFLQKYQGLFYEGHPEDLPWEGAYPPPPTLAQSSLARSTVTPLPVAHDIHYEIPKSPEYKHYTDKSGDCIIAECEDSNIPKVQGELAPTPKRDLVRRIECDECHQHFDFCIHEGGNQHIADCEKSCARRVCWMDASCRTCDEKYDTC
ncbi:hypothetical protein K504DRAFT_461798 [Pleomassaria siparia CBS 279.74]|uniref:Uncharacterized protein n=1 Tax=Pleomassaria siparia CBS 279.74 TaxID=1314801 RepID=A0A6G1KK14_9PLEO|nr:hypothetical protein K504DRAFT_461798 [Pleomassaria siparia CBS 279.74]